MSVPSILQGAIKKTQSSIMELLEQLMQRIYKFTSAVENVVQLDFSDEELGSSSEKKFADSITDDDLQWSIQMLAALRQQEIYIRFVC